MAHAGFVHLRNHSAYSLSEGALRIPEMAALAQRHHMPAVAITDTNNLFGGLEFSQAMAKAGVQPVVGCQLALVGAAPAQGNDGVCVTTDGTAKALRKPDPDPIVLLAQSEIGYGNLLDLSSKAFLETPVGEMPRIDMADLSAAAAGLICLSGGALGPIGRLLREGRDDLAGERCRALADLFPGRFYIELQRHGLAEERESEPGLLKLAYALDLPLVATNECFFADETMYEAHDALLCVAAGAYVAQTDRRRLTPQHRFKSAEEMRLLFADLPEAIDNTMVVARRCAYMAPARAPILPSYKSAAGRSEADELRAQAVDGLEHRLQAGIYKPEMDDDARAAAARPYRERLDFEVEVIEKMGFPGYFLIVADFIKWAKARNIPVGPGRGSGAGSVVAWSLTITDLDPLEFGLLFERFLNPDRVSMPDFDIDFCQDRRDEVIRYVQNKYGQDHVAQIITFQKLQARAALRDVGRVLQLPFKQIDRICKLVPNNPAKPVTLQEAIDLVPGLEQERAADSNVDRMMSIALKLEGLYRNASTHAAGVVIGDRPLSELVPLYRDPRSDMPVTQFSMKYAEASGLVKFDFLGLKTLTVLDHACRLLADRGIEVDLAAIPRHDDEAYDMLGRGDTVGVFQLESSGMRDVLRQLKPDSFEDIIALVALYRPGPMDNIPRFIRTKHGQEEPDYLHDRLRPIVEETYGVIIYQEQVMQIAQVLSGYSLGEADLLRRAMGKKIKAEMNAQRDRFISGATALGVDNDQATTIFDLVDKFAGYGFNKSHAAAYALVAWHTAWVKVKYPHEFFAASMTLDFGNTDKLNIFQQELKRLDMALLPPDINRSRADFAVEANAEGAPIAIRYALAAIKNVGQEAMQAVVEEREANGLYKDLFDLAERVEPTVLNKRQMENLARAGAFDSLNDNRAQVLKAIELMIAHANVSADERTSGQASLFGGSAGTSTLERPALPTARPWLPAEQLAEEFDAIGFYLSAHPIDALARPLAQQGVQPAATLLAALNGAPRAAKIAGTLLSRRDHRTARGTSLAFLQASDPSGVFEVTMFSEQLAAYAELIEIGRSLVFFVEGKVEADRVRLSVQEVRDADAYAADAAQGVRLYVDEPDSLAPLKTILQRTGRGRGLVSLVLKLDQGGGEVEMDVPERYRISPSVRQSLKAVSGVLDVQEI